MPYEVIVSPSALDDMLGILRYVGDNLAAPETAHRLLDDIETAIRSLCDAPKKYAFVLDERLAALGYRKLRVKNYYVFYVVNDTQKTVEVDRVLYVRRDWQRIL
jgi:plasmid stabilization system protein ParE